MNNDALKGEYKLGELLVDLGLVTKVQVEQAFVLSSLTTLPLGKILTLLDYVPEHLVKYSIEAQSLLRDKLITLEIARLAIDKVTKSDMNFPEALSVVGFNMPDSGRTRLGELLTDAKKLESTQLEFGLSLSDTSGLPLGQVLVLMHKITEDFLRIALALQRELRAGTVERDKVILKLAKVTDADDTSSLLPAAGAERIKLGELFIAAGLCSEKVVDLACENAKDRNLLIGEFLVKEDLVSPTVLSLALKLQSFIWGNRISRKRAAIILKEASTSLTVEDLGLQEGSEICEMDDTTISLYSFLKLSGFLSEELIDAAVDKLQSQPRLHASVMRNANFPENMDANSGEAAIREVLKNQNALRYILNELNPAQRPIIDSGFVLHQLVREGRLSLKEALFNFSIKRCDLPAGMN